MLKRISPEVAPYVISTARFSPVLSSAAGERATLGLEEEDLDGDTSWAQEACDEFREAPAGPREAERNHAQEQAERAILEARLQASETLRGAEERSRQIEAEARERGYHSGLEAAREAQRQLLEDLAAQREEMRAEQERFFDGLETEVVRLTLAVAEQIIRQEVNLHPEIVVGVARAAISRLKGARSLRVNAHPADLEALSQRLGDSLPDRPDELAFHANQMISRGGCTIDSERGSVDARLETQLGRVSAAVLGEQTA